jgi:hypothetical protein
VLLLVLRPTDAGATHDWRRRGVQIGGGAQPPIWLVVSVAPSDATARALTTPNSITHRFGGTLGPCERAGCGKCRTSKVLAQRIVASGPARSDLPECSL